MIDSALCGSSRQNGWHLHGGRVQSGKGIEGKLLDERFHVFVLKLWCEQCETVADSLVWRGSIENAETRHVVYFNDLAELSDHLRGHMADRAFPPKPPTNLREYERRGTP